MWCHGPASTGRVPPGRGKSKPRKTAKKRDRIWCLGRRFLVLPGRHLLSGPTVGCSQRVARTPGPGHNRGRSRLPWWGGRSSLGSARKEKRLDVVSPDTRLLGPASLGFTQARRAWVGRATGEYTPGDVDHILRLYVTLCYRAGLDLLVPLCQLGLETGWLTSHWSQRPRRNPAGIGVTGVPGAGISFPSWMHAARAHVGRLLAYAIGPADLVTSDQRALIEEALEWRMLPPSKRGLAPTLGGLARSWAEDPEYAWKLSRIGNSMLEL